MAKKTNKQLKEDVLRLETALEGANKRTVSLAKQLEAGEENFQLLRQEKEEVETRLKEQVKFANDKLGDAYAEIANLRRKFKKRLKEMKKSREALMQHYLETIKRLAR